MSPETVGVRRDDTPTSCVCSVGATVLPLGGGEMQEPPGERVPCVHAGGCVSLLFLGVLVKVKHPKLVEHVDGCVCCL